MATDSINITVANQKEVMRRLNGLGRKLANKVIRQALRSASNGILNTAKAEIDRDNAPEWEDTGTLKRSLRVRAGKRRKGEISVRVATRDGWFRGETFYGAFREFGHKIGKRANNEAIGVRKRKRRNAEERVAIEEQDDARAEVRPYKFIEPAYQKEGPGAAAKIEREILAGIEREANSGN